MFALVAGPVVSKMDFPMNDLDSSPALILASLACTITVTVHNDSDKFQHSFNSPKMAFHCLIFQGH